MRIKKFSGKTLADAMALAEAEFGPEVVVLGSVVRSVRRPGGGDGGREQWVEITAGEPEGAGRPAPSAAPAAGGAGGAVAVADAAGPPWTHAPAATGAPPGGGSREDRGRVLALTLPRPRWRQAGAGAAGAGRRSPGLPEPGEMVHLLDLYRVLTEAAMPPDLALELVELTLEAGGSDSLPAPEAVAALGDALDARIARAEPPAPGERAVLALVGPSGSGKTTTAAKLAALWGLVEGRQVALVSADASRAGGFVQLEAYAQLMDLDIARAHGPDALAEAVAAADAELVLVDFPGKNPRNLLHMAELKAHLDACRPAAVYCCLPATMQPEEARTQLERFLRLGASHLITTKLDESGFRGAAVAVAAGAGIPWAFWTVGPNVPEDLEVPSGRKLAAGFVRAASQLRPGAGDRHAVTPAAGEEGTGW